MLTPQQEQWLAAFADKNLAAETAEITQHELTTKLLAREEFIKSLEEEQQLAKAKAIADFDAGITTL